MITELYLSDLHIGLEPDGRLDVLPGWLAAHPPGKIIVHGDTLHLAESTLAQVMDTRDWRTLESLARQIPTEIIPGNHDYQLEKKTGEALGGCRIIAPYVDKWDCWHSHWHEFDPITNISQWWYRAFAHYFIKTPYQLLQPKTGNPVYLSACQVIHTNILNRRRHKIYIGGHTHLPLDMIIPDLGIELWNCGDLVDSFSAITREDDNQLRLIFLNS